VEKKNSSDMIHFSERGRVWETKGQHVCFANASHKRLSASLAVWGFPNGIPRGKAGVSRLLSRWIFCTPKKTGAAKLTLRSKVLDPTALYFCLIVKGPHEMSL
jgi:hypothetical protein